MNNISDFMNVEWFIKTLVLKLYENPALHHTILDSNENKIGSYDYFTVDQIINATRSILSPTKAKLWKKKNGINLHKKK